MILPQALFPPRPKSSVFNCFSYFDCLWTFISASIVFVHFLTLHLHCVLQRFRRISSYSDTHFWIPPDFFYGKAENAMIFNHFQICSKTLQNSFARTPTFPMVLDCFCILWFPPSEIDPKHVLNDVFCFVLHMPK